MSSAGDDYLTRWLQGTRYLARHMKGWDEMYETTRISPHYQYDKAYSSASALAVNYHRVSFAK